MVASMLRHWITVACLSASIFLSAEDAQSQQTITDIFRQSFREGAKESKLASGLQSLSIFSVTPGISAAVFHPDTEDSANDSEIQTYKIPFYYDFEPFYAGVRPYTELTLSYVHVDEKDNFEVVPGQPSKLDADIDSYSALGGIGVTIPLYRDFSLRPILLAGYSRTDIDGTFRGPFSEELETASTNLIRNADTNAWLLGGALQLNLKKYFENRIEILTNVRYDYLYARTFAASDPVLESTDDFSILTSSAEISGPTPLTVFGRETRWIAFLGNTYLPGEKDNRESGIGFDYFFEIGGGAAVIDPSIIKGIAGLGLRGSLIVGEDVHGWSLGLSLEF